MGTWKVRCDILSLGTHISNFSPIPAMKNCAVLIVLYWKLESMMKFHILLYFNAVSHGALQSFKSFAHRSGRATSQLSLRVAPVSSCLVHRTLRDVYENRMSVNVTHPRSVEMRHETRPRWVCKTHCNLRQAMYRRVFRGNEGLQPHSVRKLIEERKNVNSSAVDADIIGRSILTRNTSILRWQIRN